jgi:hypothetical protein
MIVNHLGTVAGVVPHRFVGQGSTSPSDPGMDRETQQGVLRRFKAGEFNVLVATKAAEEGLDVADCDMVAFYESTASVIQFIQRQGRAGRRRDGDIAIMLANCTVDQLNAAALDEKLGRLPGIYYRVQRIKVSPSLLKAVASTPVLHRPVVALVHPECLLAREIVASLRRKGIEARLDPTIKGDILIGGVGGVGVRVITLGDAEGWDVETTREELPGVAKPIIAVHVEAADRPASRIIEDLRALLAGDGIDVVGFEHVDQLVARACVVS